MIERVVLIVENGRLPGDAGTVALDRGTARYLVSHVDVRELGELGTPFFQILVVLVAVARAHRAYGAERADLAAFTFVREYHVLIVAHHFWRTKKRNEQKS